MNERGLHGKYIVERVDGRDAPGEKHHTCRLFVLDLTHDHDARTVARVYARLCGNLELSADLRRLVDELERDATT